MTDNQDSAPSSVDSTPSEPDVEARYESARKAYREGDLQSALGILRECYDATHAANLLFNIAQLHRELGECSEAIEFYQRYVVEAPAGERASDAESFIATLSPGCKVTRQIAPAVPRRAERKATATAEATMKPVATTRRAAPDELGPRGADPWITTAWVAAGVGAIATAGTLYASIQASRARNDVEHPRSTQEGLLDSRYWQERHDDFYRARNWAYAMGSLAIASAGVVAYTLVLAPHNEREATHSLSLTTRSAGASVDYSWRF